MGLLRYLYSSVCVCASVRAVFICAWLRLFAPVIRSTSHTHAHTHRQRTTPPTPTHTHTTKTTPQTTKRTTTIKYLTTLESGTRRSTRFSSICVQAVTNRDPRRCSTRPIPEGGNRAVGARILGGALPVGIPQGCLPPARTERGVLATLIPRGGVLVWVCIKILQEWNGVIQEGGCRAGGGGGSPPRKWQGGAGSRGSDLHEYGRSGRLGMWKAIGASNIYSYIYQTWCYIGGGSPPRKWQGGAGLCGSDLRGYRQFRRLDNKQALVCLSNRENVDAASRWCTFN